MYFRRHFRSHFREKKFILAKQKIFNERLKILTHFAKISKENEQKF